MKGQPLSRSNHTSSVLNDSNLIVFGGEDEASKLTNTLSEYVIDSKQWKSYNTKSFDQIPIERAGHSMVKSHNNHEIYIFGGDAGPKLGRLNDFWKLDMNKINEKDAFTLLNSLGQTPTKRMKHSSTIYDTYMFIFGGCNNQNLDENDAKNNQNDENDECFDKLYVINLNKQPLTWYKISINGLPQRIRHTFDVLNVIETDNYFELSLVIVCGEDKNAYLQNDIFILQCKSIQQMNINFDINNEEKKDNENKFECLINSNNWKCIKVEGIPFEFAPRFGHSCVILPFININEENNGIILRDIVVFGGYSGEMSVLNDFWLLSIEMNIQTSLCKLKQCKKLQIKGLPSARHGHSLNIFNNNRLIIYGGINLMFQTFNDISIVDINLKEWKGQKQLKQLEYKVKGMNENEKQSAFKQFKNMGFADELINNALSNAKNFNDALGKLLG